MLIVYIYIYIYIYIFFLRGEERGIKKMTNSIFSGMEQMRPCYNGMKEQFASVGPYFSKG